VPIIEKQGTARTWSVPYFCTLITYDTTKEVFMDPELDALAAEAGTRIKWLEIQLAEAKRKIEELETELKRVKPKIPN
jgi:hypothetical protein